MDDLDARVADKVMDLVPCEKWGVQRFTEFGPIYFGGECDHGNGDGCYPAGDPPKYSENMSAAFNVVEKVYERGLGWMLFSPNYNGTKWHAYQATSCADPDSGDWYELDGDTAPEAICLAALKAVGEEI